MPRPGDDVGDCVGDVGRLESLDIAEGLDPLPHAAFDRAQARVLLMHLPTRPWCADPPPGHLVIALAGYSGAELDPESQAP